MLHYHLRPHIVFFLRNIIHGENSTGVELCKSGVFNISGFSLCSPGIPLCPELLISRKYPSRLKLDALFRDQNSTRFAPKWGRGRKLIGFAERVRGVQDTLGKPIRQIYLKTDWRTRRNFLES